MVDVDYITALADYRQIAANCRHVIASCRYVTRRLYITSSGATALLLSFLQLQILVYRQSNYIDLRDPLAVHISQLTKSLIVVLLKFLNKIINRQGVFILLFFPNKIYFQYSYKARRDRLNYLYEIIVWPKSLYIQKL